MNIIESVDLEGVQTALLAIIAGWCVFDVFRYMILRRFK